MVFFFNSVQAIEKINKNPAHRLADSYETNVTFPAGFSIGDYIEFVGVQPISAGELNIKLLQKVEELTLHLIEKDKQLNVQGGQVIKLEAKLIQQDKILQEILKKLK